MGNAITSPGRTFEKKVLGVKNREDSWFVSDAEKQEIRRRREEAARQAREAEQQRREREAQFEEKRKQIQTETKRTTDHSQTLASQAQQHKATINTMNNQISQLQTQIKQEKNKTVQNREKIQKMENDHQLKVQEYTNQQRQLENTLTSERQTNQQIRKKKLEEHLLTIDHTIKEIESHLEEKQQALDDKQFEHDVLNKVLIKEEEAAREANVLDFDEMDEKIQTAKRVVLLGNTGDGKSTLGNRLCGDDSRRGNHGPFLTSSGGRSETKAISWEYTENGFLVFDTPGRGDTDDEDRIHATDLVSALRGIGHVHAFVIVRNVTNARLSDPDKGILREIATLLGEDFWRNVIMVFVRVDDEDEEKDEFEPRREQIPQILKQDLGVSVPIEVFGIGKLNFAEKRGEILDAVLRCNEGEPFVSHALKSPLEERRDQVKQEREELQSLNAALDELRQTLAKEEEKRSEVLAELHSLG